MLEPALVESILERLGFSAAPKPDADGLADIYVAWCRSVPFDNLIKRIHLVSGDSSPLPNGMPDTFFDCYLRHGTGGTCWPSAAGLHALLVSLGFDARRGSAAMADTMMEGAPQHSHGTTLVRIDGVDHWVDSSMLTDRVLPLHTGETTRLGGPIHPLRAEPVGNLWRIWWEPRGHGEEMSCLLLDENSTQAHYLARYEYSRAWSPFNLWVHAVRNTDEGRVSVTNGSRFQRSAETIDKREMGADRERILIEEFGYSEEIVAALPPDDPAPVLSPA
jgi:N-hydroxyarylamine O-acetyltransferase